MSLLQKIVLGLFLITFNNLISQVLLTTFSEVKLFENTSTTAKEIKILPAHKNVQFIEYVPADGKNGFFKVNVFGMMGYINRNSVIYDDAFYLALKASSKEIDINDLKYSEIIYFINLRKIEEEKIWATQKDFESENFSDLIEEIQRRNPSLLSIKNNPKIEEIQDGYCMKSLSTKNAISAINILSPTMMNLINSEFINLEKFFHLDITLTYDDDGPYYYMVTKTIHTGNNYINNDLAVRKSSKYVNEVYKASLAHEFAHALQHENGMFDYWKDGKQPELHADFLAGFYIGKNGLITKDKLSSFADEFAEIGDTLFFSPQHHGTPAERQCAFLEGYKVALDYNFNIYEAYNAGIDYIKLLYPCDAFAIIREYSKTEYNNTNYTLPTGSYTFSSSEENMVFCNLYKQPLGEASPGKDLQFNNLTPGSYIVIPAKKLKSGKLKYYSPYTFEVKADHTGRLTINSVGSFAIRTYSITF